MLKAVKQHVAKPANLCPSVPAKIQVAFGFFLDGDINQDLELCKWKLSPERRIRKKPPYPVETGSGQPGPAHGESFFCKIEIRRKLKKIKENVRSIFCRHIVDNSGSS